MPNWFIVFNWTRQESLRYKILSVGSSNPLALPDFHFYWFLSPVASVVIRIRDIVCFVSSIVFFSNHGVWKCMRSLVSSCDV